MTFSTPTKEFPLGDAITVICRVRRACTLSTNPTYDESTEMICSIIQDSSSHLSNNTTHQGHGATLSNYPGFNPVDEMDDNSSVSSSNTDPIHEEQHPHSETSSTTTGTSSIKVKMASPGPKLFFKPIPLPPSRRRASSTATHLKSRAALLQKPDPAIKKRFHSTSDTLNTETSMNTSMNSSMNTSISTLGYSNSLLVGDDVYAQIKQRKQRKDLNDSDTTFSTMAVSSSSKKRTTRKMKKKSLAAVAAACFAIDPKDAHSTDEENCDYTIEQRDGNTSSVLSRHQTNQQPLQFLLIMSEVTKVEMAADARSSSTPLPKNRSRSSTTPKRPPKSSSSSTPKWVHPHQFTVTITTPTEQTELTFYNYLSKELIAAFLRSTLRKNIIRLKTLSFKLPQHQLRPSSSKSLNRNLTRPSSRSLHLMGTDSGSYVDMDNFEGMAVNKRFENESFVEKMKRRCARLAIRAEEGMGSVCLCFDLDYQHEDLMKEIERESTVNTSIISDMEWDMFDDFHDDEGLGQDYRRSQLFDEHNDENLSKISLEGSLEEGSSLDTVSLDDNNNAERNPGKQTLELTTQEEESNLTHSMITSGNKSILVN